MTEVWGLLQKSQSDGQTIDEAIAAAVLAHEQDPDSHLGSGESLQSHKASEIIDHLAGSVVPDKLLRNFYSEGKMPIFWNSLDPFYISNATPTLGFGYCFIHTSDTAVSTVYMLGKDTTNFQAKFSQNPILEFDSYISVNSNAEFFIGLGDMACSEDAYSVGFSYHGGVLYAHTYNQDTDITNEVVISGISFPSYHVFSIEYQSGVAARFFIDNTLVATISADLPDSGFGPFFEVWIKKVSSGLTPGFTIGPLCITRNQSY